MRNICGCPNDFLIVTDQHEGIKKAISFVYPGIPHYFCSYHISKNILHYGKEVNALYKKTVYTHTLAIKKRWQNICYSYH